MKTANSYQEASDMAMAVPNTNGYIEYVREENHEEVARKFEERYGVEPISVVGGHMLIPTTPEIEQDFCYSEEGIEETCLEMNLRVDDFEF